MGQRQDWLDTVKGIAMVMVIWGHCGSANMFYNGLYYIHLPLFIITSGYLLAENSGWRSRRLMENVHRRATQLLYPYIAMWVMRTVFFYIRHLELRTSFSFNQELYRLYSMTNGTCWFLIPLFTSTILFLVTDKWIQGRPILLIIQMIIGISSVWATRQIANHSILSNWATAAYFYRFLYRAVLLIGKTGAFLTFLSMGYLLSIDIRKICVIVTPPADAKWVLPA